GRARSRCTAASVDGPPPPGESHGYTPPAPPHSHGSGTTRPPAVRLWAPAAPHAPPGSAGPQTPCVSDGAPPVHATAAPCPRRDQRARRSACVVPAWFSLASCMHGAHTGHAEHVAVRCRGRFRGARLVGA